MTRQCEIRDCYGEAIATVSGFSLCKRCCEYYETVGGRLAVHFHGRWHGIRGASYTPHEASIFPGIDEEDSTHD